MRNLGRDAAFPSARTGGSLQRECQRRAAGVLAALLESDTPTVTWDIGCGPYPDLYVDEPKRFPSLDGQAPSHQAVRDFAAYFGTEVTLAHGTTPTTVTVLDGIGVRVWCAPQYRDDQPDDDTGEVAS